LERRAAAPVADRVLLVGDAAGYIDAITGEGISLALAQALAAAEAAAPLLQRWPESALSRRELRPYAAAYRDSVRAYKFFTRLALFLSRRAGLLDRLAPLLNRRPAAFEAILSANMGRKVQ
jgi:flavin-dependent dehydrogenase